MEDFATKVFTLDRNDVGSTSSSSQNQCFSPIMNSTQIQLQQPIEYEEGSQTKGLNKVKNINPYYSYFPNFYHKELKISFVNMIIWSTLLALTFGLCSWCAFEIFETPSVNDWTLLTLVPIVGLVIALFFVHLVKYANFKTEAKTINFKDEKVISVNITKIYKSLKVGYINVNWMSLLSYTIFLLALLTNCLICCATYHVTIGDVYTPIHEDGNYSYAIVFWLCTIAVLFTFLFQAFTLVRNYVRYSRIENFYSFMLVPTEELVLLKKKYNRRNLVIYLGVVGMVGLICFCIVKLVKRKKTVKATTVINA